MKGRIADRSLVTLKPCDPEKLIEGDAVLVWVGDRDTLHLIKKIEGGRFLIGDNRGNIDGWVKASDIYGIVVDVKL